MAYPDGNIDATVPSDNDLLAEGDDAIREFKRQVYDRLATIVADPDADPMVLSEIVDTAQIVDGAVTTAKIDDDAVTTAKIADDAVTSAQIADGAVVEAALAGSAVTADKIAANAVTNSKIIDNAVTISKMADSSVGTSELVDANVTAAKLATDSVTTSKIVDENVTNAKLADNAVTGDKIADGAVTSAKLDSSILADVLEMRKVDVVLGAVPMVKDTVYITAPQAFTGLLPNDCLIISPPAASSDSQANALVVPTVVAKTDSFILMVRNVSGGPLPTVAGTYSVYCIKPKSDWP